MDGLEIKTPVAQVKTEVKSINIDYGTIVTLRTIQDKSVQDVADHFHITWEEAREAIRDYGLVVRKTEKAPDNANEKGYKIVLVDTAKIVPAKEKAIKV